MTIIITHPGSAHLDDFLSCCLVLFKFKDIDEIRRREPTKSEINHPDIWVLDVGDKLDPAIKCYDHHQIGGDDSTLSLLLKEWDLWDKAMKVYKWLKIVVMMDTQGPNEVRKFLKINSYTLASLDSFVERTLIRFFEDEEVINGKNILFSLMREIGKHFFTSIRDFFKIQEKVEKKMKFKRIKGVLITICFEDMKHSEHISRILKAKRKEKCPNERGGIFIYPNKREQGTIVLKRYEDDKRVDFARIKDYEKVKFSHKQGYYVSLYPLSDKELERYLSDSIVELN